MESSGLHISYSRAELAARVASVTQAARVIRSELALTICESSEVRIASRQLRLDTRRTAEQSAEWRQRLRVRKAQRRRWIAQAIVQILASRGYSAFVADQPRDSASIQ
jgi:hypothetical protein